VHVDKRELEHMSQFRHGTTPSNCHERTKGKKLPSLDEKISGAGKKDKGKIHKRCANAFCGLLATIDLRANSLGDACNNAILNAAFVLASEDLEVSLITPFRVPRVRDEPVRLVVLHTPAENLDGVSTQQLAR
jgi:hypothetical protein